MTLFDNSDIEHLDQKDFKEVARTLEFCSTNNEGITLLFSHKIAIFKILA
jgi:hypothetical protein